MRKKKRKKNIIYLLVIIILACILTLICYKGKIFDSNKPNDNNTTNNGNKNDLPNKDEEKDPYLLYRKCLNFKLENGPRYIAYKKSHESYDYEKVVNHVNIGLDKEFYSYIKDADTSKGVLLLMNKYLKLSENYEPDDLEEISSKYFIYGNSAVRRMRKEAKEAFEMLSEASIANGTPVYGQSAYRPYSMQEKLYKNAVSSMGQKQADIDTARPGHSEHQTGLTIDVSASSVGCLLTERFGSTKEGRWLAKNAHKYGYIIRYPKGKTKLTGYSYEPWHIRYVGVSYASYLKKNKLTLEELYGVNQKADENTPKVDVENPDEYETSPPSPAPNQ